MFDGFQPEVKNEDGNFLIDGVIVPGAVKQSSAGGLLVDITGFTYEMDGTKGSFAGAVSQALTPSSTNYIYIDSSGVLQINIVGFLANNITHMRLAIVTTSVSDITQILDQRAFLGSEAGSIGLIGTQDLDDAYDNGRIITADAGPIDLTGYTTQAPFRIAPTGTAPNASLVNGQEFTFSLAGGKPCKAIYDSTRGKWLSVSENSIIFTEVGAANNALLRCGVTASINTGFRVPFDCTIIGVTCRAAGGNLTKGFTIYRNPTAIALYRWNNIAGQHLDNAANVDLNAGDYLHVTTDNIGGAVNDPIVALWLSWRF